MADLHYKLNPQLSAEEVSRLVEQLYENQLVQVANKTAQIHPHILDMRCGRTFNPAMTTEALLPKLRELKRLAEGYCISEWLSEVLLALRDHYEEGEEDGEGGEDDDEDEEEESRDYDPYSNVLDLTYDELWGR
ncbi:hypothetical protein N7499_006548 [Penicillium canescens]|uniref:Uncharacterized protein n=1 Tax=Penicillium canescens TaxID=5083 RepID=A0AAD6IDQ1_PENCN|nr:uncharacterized protein N7446_002241 [Penicillium canescens]KAJ5997135.1 hypothetical protein N7522_008795 [Penicillium canescens]KAJ6044044.1 hypothetical protein N7460_005399 [Penicillium canescens]KAJ6055516.1 hypothetical protein N7444_004614 [Penicillium canescens]KAJ6074464.1 hypothetical protein N7446_002241 [Penicillium canescens]KAJ6081674.1 hypothetical protein N7499_006548 [Penicillium canescens]